MVLDFRQYYFQVGTRGVLSNIGRAREFLRVKTVGADTGVVSNAQSETAGTRLTSKDGSEEVEECHRLD